MKLLLRARPLLALAPALVLAVPASAAVQIPGFELVHTAPVETSLATPDIRDPVTVWCEMIDGARHSLDFEQYYVAGKPGEPLDRVLAALENAGRRGVAIRFMMEKKGLSASEPATLERLRAIPNLTFRLLDFSKIGGGDGIIHAKFFIVDGREAYAGSQNFDWRSLEHIDETGLRITDRRITGQLQAIFAHDWAARPMAMAGGVVPPLRRADDVSGEAVAAFLVASPGDFDPPGVGDSQAELPRLIGEARHDITVEVMEYSALTRSGAPYPIIDDALRAAGGRGVQVHLLIADWDLTAKRLPGLLDLAQSPGVTIRVAHIPQAASGPIPYARVVHTKVMVVDGATAWVGTSNWEGGYFDHSRNVEIVLRNRKMAARLGAMQAQLWNSAYVAPLDQAIKDKAARAAPAG